MGPVILFYTDNEYKLIYFFAKTLNKCQTLIREQQLPVFRTLDYPGLGTEPNIATGQKWGSVKWKVTTEKWKDPNFVFLSGSYKHEIVAMALTEYNYNTLRLRRHTKRGLMGKDSICGRLTKNWLS